MSYRITTFCAGFFGLGGVLLGALGAHGRLHDVLLESGTLSNWETAVHYQLVHGIALFGAAVWQRINPGQPQRRITWAANCWVLGVVFFSGSLYVLALGGPRFIGPLTPLGGLALMTGWAWIIAEALAKPSAPAT
jgi:uncharacterized membrane protein YgdD (TMEM256/DUF423 family)